MTLRSTRGDARAPRLWLAALPGLLLVGPVGCDEKDDTPPTVVSSVPAQEEADWDGRISITVSEPLDATSLVDASVRLLEDGTEIRKKLVLSEDGKTVSVIPDQALDLPARLDVVLNPVWKDLAGNTLAGPERGWGWEARPWRRLPAPTRPGAGAGSPPSLALEGEGHLLLAFAETADPQGAPGGTVVTRWTGGAWERFPLNPEEVAGQAWLAVDGAGGIFLAASELGEGRGPQSYEGHFYVRRWDGRAWAQVGPVAGTYSWKSVVGEGTRLSVTRGGSPVLTFDSEESLSPGVMWSSTRVLEDGAWKNLAAPISPRPWMPTRGPGRSRGRLAPCPARRT